jgi:hypothetical protein
VGGWVTHHARFRRPLLRLEEDASFCFAGWTGAVGARELDGREGVSWVVFRGG